MNGQWVRFDPTAAVAPSRVDVGLAEALPAGEPVPRLARVGNGWLKRVSLRWDKLNHSWQQTVIDFNNESQAKFWQKLGMPDPQLWQITVGLLLLAAAWCLWVLRPNRSAMIALTEDEKYWKRYTQHLQTLGVTRAPGDTGAQLTEKAIRQLDDHSELITRLGLAFSKLKFEPISNERKNVIRQQLKRDLKKLAGVARRAKSKSLAKQTISGKATAAG